MASSLPKTMRVVHQPDINSSDLVMDEGPVPVPKGPSDILIKVVVTSPCLGELTWRAMIPDAFPADKEDVPGQDVAGTVVKAPEGSAFKAGDDVFGRIDGSRPGGCREYAILLEEEAALKPSGLSWTDAAAIPLSALTAWQAVFIKGSLEYEALFGDEEARRGNAQKRVFIAGGGTSVGLWAVQFAALAGAGAVVALASGAKADFLKQLGASEIVDYKKTSAEAWVQGSKDREVDLIIDCVGGDAMGQLWSVVKDGGEFWSICMPPESVRPAGNEKKPSKAEFFIVRSLGAQLAEIARLVEGGKARPLVDSVVGFEQFAEAFEKVNSRKANGKVIIRVSGD